MLNWEVGYYKRKAADRASALSHHDKAVMKPQIMRRSEDMVDRALFKYSLSCEDTLLDKTCVNVIPPSLVSVESKRFQCPGHLSSSYKFFTIRGESMLGRKFFNTTHQGEIQIANQEQKCLSFIGTHMNITTPVGVTFYEREPYSVCVYPGEPLDNKTMRDLWCFNDILRFTTDVANGLMWIHSSNFIHLSLSPSAIYRREDTYVIGGFELSCR